jgi:hypothetical protein
MTLSPAFQNGVNFTRNFTESYTEIVESLQNKTLIVTTIFVSYKEFCPPAPPLP